MRISRKFFVAALVAAAPAAHAGEIDALAGVSSTIRHTLTDVEFVDFGGDTREWRGIRWEPIASIGHIGTRSDHYGDLGRPVWIGAAGARVVDWWGGMFFGFELGYASTTTDAVSSHEQFVSSLGWRRDRFEVMLRHVSNGHIFEGRNLGETMVLVGWRF